MMAEENRGRYDGNNLVAGCLFCGADIPDKQARRRAQTCSTECYNALRNVRRDRAEIYRAKLRCQVCRGDIPPSRPGFPRLRNTCSDDCRNELRRWRFLILKQQKCPHCLHPCTPEEQEDFHKWRASRGPMQAFLAKPGRGNVTAKRAAQLRAALERAIGRLRDLGDDSDALEEFTQLLGPVTKLAVDSEQAA